MNLGRMLAIMQQEYFITKRSLEVIIDLFFFSSITIVVFGFVSKFLAGDNNDTAAYYLIVGLALWEVVRVGQYSVTVAVLWNVWSRNLSNLYVSPLSSVEYLGSLMITALLKSLIVLILVGIIMRLAFGFDLLEIGIINLALHFLNLTIFSWSMGIFILGLIYRFGTRIQALSWGLIFLFQPLSAAFFPLSVLPEPLQKIAKFVPTSYVFESARKNLENQKVDWGNFAVALVINILYFAGSVLFFYILFKKSKQTGQFARNEG